MSCIKALVGDLGQDTAVQLIGDGRYRARVSADWNLWGPVGGYLASIALRAAGSYTAMAQPASLSCHYLSTPYFDDVDLEVTRLRKTRRAESLHIRMTQDGKPVLDALAWSVAAGLRGPERTWIKSRPVPPPDDLELFDSERVIGHDAVSAASFWRNVEIRKIAVEGNSDGVGGSVLRSWDRYCPRPVFGDPWIDACRAVISIDVSIFPAAAQALPSLAFMAPNLDLYVAFHTPPPQQEFLLVESQGAAAGSGLVGGQARVWSSDGVLTASGASQLLCSLI